MKQNFPCGWNILVYMYRPQGEGGASIAPPQQSTQKYEFYYYQTQRWGLLMFKGHADSGELTTSKDTIPVLFGCTLHDRCSPTHITVRMHKRLLGLIRVPNWQQLEVSMTVPSEKIYIYWSSCGWSNQTSPNVSNLKSRVNEGNSVGTSCMYSTC